MFSGCSQAIGLQPGDKTMVIQVRNTDQSWGVISIGIHWLVAIIVIGLFGLGLWMTSLSYYDAWYTQGPYVHKSIGVLLFALMVVRLLWRLVNTPTMPLPNHATWEKTVAHVVHLALYVLLFATMISGYLISTADGREIEVFHWFEVPAFTLGIEQQADIAGTIHFYLAVSLTSLVVLHAAGALKHHFLDKDDTLKRMLRTN